MITVHVSFAVKDITFLWWQTDRKKDEFYLLTTGHFKT